MKDTDSPFLNLPTALVSQSDNIFQYEIEGKNIVRSYTPTTLDDDKGHFDLVVKVRQPH